MASFSYHSLTVLFIICGISSLTVSMVIKAGCNLSSSDISSSYEDNSDYETTSMCKTRKHRINPDDLVDPKGIWTFDSNFKQTFEVELCENEGSPCIDYPMMKTRCKQRYLEIKLQVVSKNGTRSQLKTFSIPSNCECVFYRN